MRLNMNNLFANELILTWIHKESINLWKIETAHTRRLQ